ncbi:putative short-chain type dehydrogenase [Ramaria rubella]|nr:putative short-chain type dehydrogenase [Ramaria rubella]
METEKTNRLLNRVAIVAGAGSRDSPSEPDIVGNGRASSILLARAGAFVVLVDNNLAWARRTEELISSAPVHLSHGPDRTLVVRADVTSPSECEAVLKATMERWGRVDILVNNVGIGGPVGTAVDIDPNEWRKVMDTNVLGMLLMSKYAIPQMLKTSPDDISIPKLLYPISKGAIINMTRAMAAHHGPAGIRVNAVAPGTVLTPMVVGDGMPSFVREVRKNQGPLRIEGYGWDIANAVVFLASDEARWITGVTLSVDAGRMVGQPPHGFEGVNVSSVISKTGSVRGKL